MENGKAYKFGNVDDWHTDPDMVANGAPFDAKRGRTIMVRRAGGQNRKLIAAVAEIDPNDTHAFHAIYARLVVAGWSGFVDEHGEEIPYSPDAAVALFDYCPELFFDLLIFANTRANYRAKELADDQQAVKTLSGGSEAQAPTSAN